ncbi:MAG: hypothetical protein ACFE8L_06615 [Candidatus Hodarchaeota archaeon]
MPDFRINDEWILNRVSSQSTSFSQWFSNLMKDLEMSLENLPSELRGDVKEEISKSLKDADKELATAQEELAKLGFFGKKLSDFTMKMISSYKKPPKNEITKSIEKEITKSKKRIKGLDFEFDLDFLTGKRKDLSSALYDVSKERGIKSEGLLYLIRALPDLEAFLYSTSVKKYYRDHTEHALRVAVLGDFMLEQDFGQGSLEGLISEIIDLDKKLLKDKFWWVVGLLHDIGYPLGKMTTAVNYSLVNQLLKCYPTLDLEFIPFEINLTWKGQQEDYLKIIEEGLSKEARALIRKGAGYYRKEKLTQDLQTFLKQPSGHPEFEFKSSIELDHGVISALSLLKGLGTPEEIKSNDEFDGYIKAARAIALHNFKANLKDYIFDEQPLAFFLMLIDELQEWGRPIPIQVKDTYFTTELKKVTLLDELLLNLDELSWMMQFKNQEAKDLMEFNFKLFSNEKKKTFGRLNCGENFPTTTINLQDIKISVNKDKKKEDIIAQDIITI